MNFTRKRLAALAAAASALAIGVPAATANAQVPGGVTAFPAIPYPSLPAIPVVTGGLTRVAVVIGPAIAGGVIAQGPGAGGQTSAAAPQAISLLSQTAGPTVAAGL
jgi:hypothetical protein